MCKNAKISPSQHLGDQTYLEEHIKEIDESVKLGKTISKWTIAIKYPVSQSKVSNIYVYFSLLEIAFFGKKHFIKEIVIFHLTRNLTSAN